MPTLFLIRGASYSGKSTLAIALVGEANVVDSDRHPLRSNPDGSYRYDATDNAIIHAACYQQCEELMRRRVMIAVANTSLFVAHLKPYLALAREHGYTVQVIHCEGLIDPLGNPVQGDRTTEAIRAMQRSRFEPFLVSGCE